MQAVARYGYDSSSPERRLLGYDLVKGCELEFWQDTGAVPSMYSNESGKTVSLRVRSKSA